MRNVHPKLLAVFFVAIVLGLIAAVSEATAQPHVTVKNETVYTTIDSKYDVPLDVLARGIDINDARRHTLTNMLTARIESDNFAAILRTDTGSYKLGQQPEFVSSNGRVFVDRFAEYGAANKELTTLGGFKMGPIDLLAGYTSFGADERHLNVANTTVNQLNKTRYSGIQITGGGQYQGDHWIFGGNFDWYPAGLTRTDSYEQIVNAPGRPEQYFDATRKVDASGLGFQINTGYSWKHVGITGSYQYRLLDTEEGNWGGLTSRAIPERSQWNTFGFGVLFRF